MKAYKITNLITGKSYIGITTVSLEKRLRQHFNNAATGEKSKFYNAIRKYSKENFVIEEIGSGIYNVDNLKKFEEQLIAQHNTLKNGYNSTKGGDGINGYKHTEEAKKRMSEVNCMRNPEIVAKMAASKRGQKASEETKKKMSAWQRAFSPTRGRKLNAEQKQRLLNLHLTNSPVAIKIEYEGVVYKSVTALAGFLNKPNRTISNRVKNNPEKYGYKVL